MAKKMPVNLADLERFMRIKPSLADTAAWFRVSPHTIERVVEETWKITFIEFREQRMVETRHNLIRKAIEMGENGNALMLIFALKNLCGWKEKHEHTGPDGGPIKHKIDLDAVKAQNSALAESLGYVQNARSGSK